MKKIYRKFINSIKNFIIFINRVKIKSAENIAIIKKRKLYKDIVWTDEQTKEFNDFWEKNYGKRIKPYWHKLYQRHSGVFNVRYMPEKIFSTVIEPKWNPYFQAKEYENKSLVELLSAGCDTNFRCPETYVSADNGVFYNEKREPVTKQEVFEILKNKKTAVLKPTKGSSSGRDIYFWEAEKFNADEQDAEIEKILKLYGGNFIAQEKIIPSKQLSDIYPNAINTFRVCTYIANGKVYHSPVALRIGSVGAKVDNIHAGGVVVYIHDDGTFDKTAYKMGYGFEDLRYEKHPDTNVVFEEQKIEDVKDIIKTAEKLHGFYSGLRMISWDFTLDVNDKPVLIEANLCGQGVWFPQMISGEGLFGEQTEAVLQEFKKR